VRREGPVIWFPRASRRSDDYVRNLLYLFRHLNFVFLFFIRFLGVNRRETWTLNLLNFGSMSPIFMTDE
jgi:hypothetical protein